MRLFLALLPLAVCFAGCMPDTKAIEKRIAETKAAEERQQREQEAEAERVAVLSPEELEAEVAAKAESDRIAAAGAEKAESERKQKIAADAEAKKISERNATTAIDAAQLMSQYKYNEVAADAAFKGRWLEVTGECNHIGKDIVGSMYVTLKAKNDEIFSIQCVFPDQAVEAVSQVKPGYVYTIRGRCDGKLGNVVLAHCTFATLLPTPAEQAAEQEKIAAEQIERKREEKREKAEAAKQHAKLNQSEVAEKQLKAAQRFQYSGKDEIAKKWYQKIVDKYPDTPAAEEARKWLSEHQ